jgi:hypothetical protein
MCEQDLLEPLQCVAALFERRRSDAQEFGSLALEERTQLHGNYRDLRIRCHAKALRMR